MRFGPLDLKESEPRSGAGGGVLLGRVTAEHVGQSGKSGPTVTEHGGLSETLQCKLSRIAI